ncbi:MAG: hypothetical protein KGZ49_07365 [Syntrophaceae bacterium]|nr:hypothetical protein [Syntrophaceae bacterium]
MLKKFGPFVKKLKSIKGQTYYRIPAGVYPDENRGRNDDLTIAVIPVKTGIQRFL